MARVPSFFDGISDEDLHWILDRLDRRSFAAGDTMLAEGDAPTEIYVPVARHYGGHYAVSLSGPATVTSASDAPVLTLQTTGAGLVEVTVTRSP